MLAGVPLETLRRVYITHQHSDHNADYGNLVFLAWASGLRTPVDTYGLPPIRTMRDLFLQPNAYDIHIRAADEGRVPLAPLFRAHEVSRPGIVLEDEHVTVTVTLACHPPVAPSLAYRFDGPERSIAISGGTFYCAALIKLARGADVLVHEVLYPPAVARLVARVRSARTLLAHHRASHTSVDDAGRVAAAAGVGTLVLSHFVPPDDPAVTDAMWSEGARAHFGGEVIDGRDLLVI